MDCWTEMVIILISSGYDLNNVERNVKHQIIIMVTGGHNIPKFSLEKIEISLHTGNVL